MKKMFVTIAIAISTLSAFAGDVNVNQKVLVSFENFAVERPAGESYTGQGDKRVARLMVEKTANQPPASRAAHMAATSRSNHQYRISRVHFKRTGHVCLSKPKQREAPVQRAGFCIEFVAFAHGGLPGDTIYSSLYSIRGVHKS